MFKILIIALVFHAVLTVNSKEFPSRKLAPEWSAKSPSNIQYKKTSDLFASMQAEPHEFFESEFSTRIDHFRPLNQQRINFTFNANTHHFENYGPLYIYLKEAYDFSTDWIEEGLMVDIARETGAALLTFDHRYFGVNRPFESASFDDLELLSVEQVLADIAVFIRAVRQSIPTAQFSRVILWGSGVGGTLAAFARSRYPHLVSASWASSAIIESSAYSWGPYDVFAYTFDINDGGQCRDLIETAYEQIAGLVIAGEGAELSTRLGLCSPVDTNSTSDVAALYEISVRAVMYYFNNFHYDGVLEFCSAMGAIEGDPLASLARWYRYVYMDEECFDPSYATAIETYSNIEWDQPGTDIGRRQWYFLQCTQVGSFLVADQYTWLPGTVDFNYHLQKCGDLFGSTFTYETVTDAYYTLRDEFSQQITNVVYTNGNLDPLRYFGRLYDPTDAGIVINIDFASKSADLPSRHANDRVAIAEAKDRIVEIITRWSQDAEEPEPEPPVGPTGEPPVGPTGEPPVTPIPTEVTSSTF